MKIIKGDLVLTENTTFNEDLKVAGNIRCEGGLWNLNCRNLNCRDLDFYAVAVAYNSFKCKSWKARREKYIVKCLDSEIEIKDEKKFCNKCGSELK